MFAERSPSLHPSAAVSGVTASAVPSMCKVARRDTRTASSGFEGITPFSRFAM
jgi:hypothetical protein